jgi:cytochrome c peroxidase
MPPRQKVCLYAAAILLLLAGCGTTGPSQSQHANANRLKNFAALPAAVTSDANPITTEKTALGKMLYYDARLSRGQDVSCNSCHPLNNYGADGRPTSEGYRHQHGDRNSPTVYNAAGHVAQFWDGRAADLEEQAQGPVLNPVEMAMPSEKAVVAVLQSIPEYAQAFHRAFPDDPDPLTLRNMAKAIAAFERKLVTPGRWDKFLNGDDGALTAEEKAGFQAFLDAGCATCHAGTYVGGNIYQKLGAAEAWPDRSDPGRYQVTHNESDRMVFKVPSLRNVAKTAPYFHDGKVKTLDEAVSTMAQHQLGKQLSDSEVKAIATWLNSLTGEVPADAVEPPVLPKSTPATPRPEI